MEADRLLRAGRPPQRSRETRDALTAALAPGRRRLLTAGVLQAAGAIAAAAVFYALAGFAQSVLDARTTWPNEWRWTLLLAGGAVARGLIGHLAARQAIDGATAIEDRLRRDLVGRLLAPDSLADGGAQAVIIMDETERIGTYAQRYWPARISAALTPLVLLVLVFALNWFVGVLLVLCAPLPAINLSIVGMGTEAAASRHGEEIRHLSGYYLDRLRGLATLKALGAERDELRRLAIASDRLTERAMGVLRVAFVSAAVLEAVVTVAVAVVASYIGLTLLGDVIVPGLPREMSLQTGLFLLLLTPLYFQPVRALAASYHERAEAMAAMASLTSLLSGTGAAARRRAPRPLMAPPEIDVQSLTVAFAGREQPALDRVSARIAPGEVVGLSGASGAGKSTLLRALVGDLCDGATTRVEGLVLLDTQAPQEIDRTTMTWLGQHPRVFPGTVADNITLGAVERVAEQAAILEAATAAGLTPLLRRLPAGLATPLGEAGWGLSRGEVHRVALARTFLMASPLLLLDEPTAHLDAASETAMIAVLRRLAVGRTVVLASHSPQVLAICDRVLHLDRGQLRETVVSRGAPAARRAA